MTAMLCACGSAGSAGEASSTTSLVEKIPDDDPTRQVYTEQSDKKSTEATPISGESTADESDAVSSVDLYQKFLNDEVKVLIRLNKIQNSEAFFGYGPSDGTEYTLSELMTTVSRDTEGHSISYAYMDCGNDGNPELAVRTESTVQATSWWEYWIIKDVSGSLECIYAREAWPRSNATINQYGLINGYGSSGAAYNTIDERYLDGTGTLRYIYTRDTIGFSVSPEGYGTLLEFNILPPDAVVLDEDADITEYLESDDTNYDDQRPFSLYLYDFDNTLDNQMNDACSYAEHTSAATSSESDWRIGYLAPLENESILEDGYPLKTQLVNAGFQIYSPDEINEMIDMQEQYYGLTQDIMEAPELEWIVLK